jgi:Tfp pilus assembly protein PilV
MVLIEVVLAILIMLAIVLGLIGYFFPPKWSRVSLVTQCQQAATGAGAIAARLKEIIDKRQTDPATAREWCDLANQDIRTWNASFVPDCSTNPIPLVNCQSL